VAGGFRPMLPTHVCHWAATEPFPKPDIRRGLRRRIGYNEIIQSRSLCSPSTKNASRSPSSKITRRRLDGCGPCAGCWHDHRHTVWQWSLARAAFRRVTASPVVSPQTGLHQGALPLLTANPIGEVQQNVTRKFVVLNANSLRSHSINQNKRPAEERTHFCVGQGYSRRLVKPGGSRVQFNLRGLVVWIS
jgi:hypothetical protein